MGGVALVPVVTLGGASGLVAAVALGAAAYPLALRALRALTPEDLDRVRSDGGRGAGARRDAGRRVRARRRGRAGRRRLSAGPARAARADARGPRSRQIGWGAWRWCPS